MVALIGRSLRALPRAASDFEFLYLEIFSKKIDHLKTQQTIYIWNQLTKTSRLVVLLVCFEMVDFFDTQINKLTAGSSPGGKCYRVL